MGDDGERTPVFKFYADRTMEALKVELDAVTIKRLMAEGAQLDEEAVCALALARDLTGLSS